MNHRRSIENDRGGIALLASLVLMVMIGMGALVIDGGYLAMRRRNLQAVADAAALAGAVKLPTSATAISDARANATQNGYTDLVAGVTVTVNSPYLANANAIEVIVQKSVSTFLGKALKINTGLVTGRAVVRSNPATDLIFANGANGCGVAACGTNLCINGSNINIQGSVHSNGSLTMSGNNTDSIQKVEYGSGCATHNFSGFASPASATSAATKPFPLPFTLATFCPCAGPNCFNIPNGNISLPGSWWQAGNGPNAGFLNPGIYCPSPANAGVSLQINGCTTPCFITGNVTLASDGPVQINGQGTVTLTAFSNNVVIYSGFAGGGNAIQIGAANLTLTGTVFARFGLIADNGTNLTVNGSLLGDSIQMGQNGSLTMSSTAGPSGSFLDE